MTVRVLRSQNQASSPGYIYLLKTNGPDLIYLHTPGFRWHYSSSLFSPPRRQTKLSGQEFSNAIESATTRSLHRRRFAGIIFQTLLAYIAQRRVQAFLGFAKRQQVVCHIPAGFFLVGVVCAIPAPSSNSGRSAPSARCPSFLFRLMLHTILFSAAPGILTGVLAASSI